MDSILEQKLTALAARVLQQPQQRLHAGQLYLYTSLDDESLAAEPPMKKMTCFIDGDGDITSIWEVVFDEGKVQRVGYMPSDEPDSSFDVDEINERAGPFFEAAGLD